MYRLNFLYMECTWKLVGNELLTNAPEASPPRKEPPVGCPKTDVDDMKK
jgi:hypothetical protein